MATNKILLYIGTYTRPAPYLKTTNGQGIYVYSLNAATGELTYLSEMQGIDNPAYLAIDHNKRYLYATSEVWGWDEGTCSAYAIDPASGALSYINKQPTLGSINAHLVVDRSNRYVLMANYWAGKTAVMLPIRADGGVAPVSSAVQHEGTGPVTARQDKSHGHCILPDPTNQYVFIADLGIDQLVGYKLDLEGGQFIPHNTFKLAPGSGPRHFLFHPGGQFAYVIEELSSTISALSYDSAKGEFGALQTISTLPAGYNGESHCAAIQITPDGKFLYGSNRGHDSIAMFAIDGQSGNLTSIGHQSTMGNTPRDFAIDPTGTFLLAANQDSDTIVTFRINRDSGTLTHTEYAAKVPTPVCLKMITI